MSGERRVCSISTLNRKVMRGKMMFIAYFAVGGAFKMKGEASVQ